jgi:hypothetical protein
VLKLERLRHTEGEPFALETCYFSAKNFAGLLSEPLERESLFGILERSYNVVLGYADEEVDATAADPRTAELLGVLKREPLLRILHERRGDCFRAGDVPFRPAQSSDSALSLTFKQKLLDSISQQKARKSRALVF